MQEDCNGASQKKEKEKRERIITSICAAAACFVELSFVYPSIYLYLIKGFALLQFISFWYFGLSVETQKKFEIILRL